MESSEDDAGTATNASRRASAREKDVGLAEDVNATSSFQRDPSDARQSCQTPAMSEDNFDGDSVPSPSAQDVNTSTEAILDMIDEIVDGPGAPKRLPLPPESVDTPHDQHATTCDTPNIIQESSKSDENNKSHPCEPASPSADVNSESSRPLVVEEVQPIASLEDPPKVNINTGSVNLLQGILPIPESVNTNEAIVSAQLEHSEMSSAKPEVPVDCPPPNIPSSSEEQTVQRISDSSECETQERTVKCVTSSDNRDNVTVESAESTSSDSVSESRAVLVEPQTRSPLRRRLVRPVVCDRRPDSTVSSTVDSHTVNVLTTEQSIDCITKDVSSSSDAVPTIHGNVKPEEIRNISEISICKAETSVSPPKKIKLIRQKIVTGSSNREALLDQSTVTNEKVQCQSTSSALPEADKIPSIVNLPQPHEGTDKSSLINFSDTEPVVVQRTDPICPEEHSQPDIEPSIQHQSPKRDDDVREGDNQQVPPMKLSLSVTNLSESLIPGSSTSSMEQENSNLCAVNSSETKPDTKINDLEQGKVKSDEEQSNKIDLEQDQRKVLPLKVNLTTSSISSPSNSDGDNTKDNQKKVPPIKLNLSLSSLSEPKTEEEQPSNICKSNENHGESETKQVPKLTIKLKQTDEIKSPVPKLTIKPIRPPTEQDSEDITVPSVTRLNIKPILKPPEMNEKTLRPHLSTGVDKMEIKEQIPCITKLNIKPIRKPPEKINDVHRKSSSSEISESEYSENDESTSTSDQASASDQGPSEVIPKVTIKLGKPGTHSEGKFYTEQNIPKLTIKGIQQDENKDEEPKLKLIISQAEEKQPEKIPKLTIKNVGKSESQPLSPKLTIKPLRTPDSSNKESEIPKMKIFTESCSEEREIAHVPKITIKPVTRSDTDTVSRTPKKIATVCNSPEHIPVVTKLNIKPILKPMDCGEMSEGSDDNVPVVSKLNIKPVIKPKDNDVDSSVDDVPKITKLNIKPIKNPEEKSSEEKDCDELNAVIDANSIPVITKLNIKPIVKPQEVESLKDTENQSSETGNSSDENTDHIPVITKLNIKPILKPEHIEESSKTVSSSEPTIPVITKLNIKPLIKPGDAQSPSSPKKDHLRSPDLHSTSVPIVTKLNIKPVVKPDDVELHRPKADTDEKVVKNPPLVMKINMKSVIESVINESQFHSEYNKCINISDEILSTNLKPTKSGNELETSESEKTFSDKAWGRSSSEPERSTRASHSPAEKQSKQNCTADFGQGSKYNDKKAVIRRSSPVTKSKTGDALEKQMTQDLINVSKCDSLLMVAPLREENLHKNMKLNEVHEKIEIHANMKTTDSVVETNMMQTLNKQKFSSVQNCTLLKKLLENTKDGLDRTLDVPKQIAMNCALPSDRSDPSASTPKHVMNREPVVDTESYSSGTTNSEYIHNIERKSACPDKINDKSISTELMKLHKMQEIDEKVNENVTKPLEITISDKITNQGSGQDSPRIILKINKTDHGSSAKIITEDLKRPDTLQQTFENTQDVVNDKSPKRQLLNSRRKQTSDTALSLSAGKRLRSSRIVENTEKSPSARRNLGKRPSITETSPPQSKEPELSVLQTKRLKLGQLLSGNKSLTITPVSISTQTSPTKSGLEMKPVVKPVNHSLLNNENCSKNGNSKLHNILSNLQAKQMQTLSFNNANCSEKTQSVSSPIELNSQQSTGSSDTVEVTRVENLHPELQEMIINENSDFRDFSIGPEDSSQDPLEMPSLRTTDGANDDVNIAKVVEVTPQPKKRGRPRKLPLSEGAKPLAVTKPAAVTLPVPALEERPQRSLRLMRDRPAILLKPRGGRGRGRGGRRPDAAPPVEAEPVVIVESAAARLDDIDPTSSRIKLPRMTEALDNMPSAGGTPLSSRRRPSCGTLPGDAPELKVVLESTLPKLEDVFAKTPEAGGAGRARGGRGGRGRPARSPRTPRARGRGRGGGRGAMYMKETMGIYGRVCGPATTTVQLFEEETCMMDDNATPAKPSHLLDEDSQSSVNESSTNESSKMKKSKFADLFDSNKVWTAADVKEYMWPPPDRPDVEPKVMMIQEQVAMFLSVKSFKRRYPALQRRPVAGAERDYLLAQGLVGQPLADLGITAVDASEVLDIMLSDYPHKYEEYRSHQRERQIAESEKTVEEVKTDEKVLRVEMKVERIVDTKPEVPKVDPEKTRQDMAAAAIASASEWNARANALRRGACVDLQSLTVQRPRAPPRAPPRAHVRPPAGFYPHALLPGQYQHCCRLYTPDQLRYFPLNTALAAPPSIPTDSSSDSEPDWPPRDSDSDESNPPPHHAAKRKKLSKAKRSSHGHAEAGRDEAAEGEAGAAGAADTCRACKLRLEANRKYTHERFLVCAHCNAKLHPSCVELSADTIRKCREYAWQCAECKSCCACRQPADDDKMLFCDLCDRGFHIYCVGLDAVPSGRWHCVECAICKSCGARSPGGLAGSAAAGGAAGPAGLAGAGGAAGPAGSPPADWHHQTRRGPGGHKVYSHSLCTPCARAYRIGRYCPLCERSFIGPKGTMQLVICKLCDRQLHQDCVKQTVPSLRVLDYTCGECRRGGITSRAAAVRLAPRTIATLFMAKRRFNKYAHRQYMESRRRDAAAADPPDPHDAPDTHDAHDTHDPPDASESEGGGDGDASDPLDGAGDP